MRVENEWNVFIFFFHLENISSLLCSTLSSSSLSSRRESSHRGCSIEKSVLKKFTTFSGKHLRWSHFLTKLLVWRLLTLLKRESNSGVFLWILRHFKEDLFWITSANDRLSQPAWDVSERSVSDLHWERYLRDLSETSQKRYLFCDVFKTSQIHLKKYVFFVTSLRRLKNISKKMSFPRHLRDVSKTSLASIFWFSKNTSQKWFRVISVGLLQYLIK